MTLDSFKAAGEQSRGNIETEYPRGDTYAEPHNVPRRKGGRAGGHGGQRRPHRQGLLLTLLVHTGAPSDVPSYDQSANEHARSDTIGHLQHDMQLICLGVHLHGRVR